MKQVNAVGVLFEDQTGKILVLHRQPTGAKQNSWGLVGGHVEPDESEEMAAIREVEEEVGVKLEPHQLKFIKTYTWDRSDSELVFSLYKVESDSNSLVIALDQTEHDRYEWADPESLYQQPDLMIGLYQVLKDHYIL